MANSEKHKSRISLANPDLVHAASHYIQGEWVSATNQATYPLIDPGTGAPWDQFSAADGTVPDVDKAVQSAHSAFKHYSQNYTPRQRAQFLFHWHGLLYAARDDLAVLLVHETGKPLPEAYAEVDYALTFVWWFAGEADRIHGSTTVSAYPGRRALVIKQPLGVAVALVPWNFPLTLMLRKASAALAAGCTMVVKPSPESCASTLASAKLAIEAGFPPGALNVLCTSLTNTPAVAEALCTHPLVKKVTFTGSTRVGRIISGLCSRGLKKVALELGGNCPFIIFEDADLTQAVEQLVELKWRHAGQACITANRIYVHHAVYDKVVAMLVEKTAQGAGAKVGHGMEEGVTMGPVTTVRGLDKAEEIVDDALKKGARLASGTGKRLDISSGAAGNDGQGGFFMAPTILADMKDNMLLSQEEVFGPVLGLFSFETEEEVVHRANNTTMGLSSYVFTKNSDRLWRMFEGLEAGMIGLNCGAASAAEAPFGGIKESGLGKESGKDVAIDEFLIAKTGTMAVQSL